MEPSLFDSLKRYVGFTEDSTLALRELHPLVAPHFVAIIDDFYEAIEAHPGARAAITGGETQIVRLKQTLLRWLDTMLKGPHDDAYFEMRARIGRVHVRIELPQAYMFTAMDRIRVHVLDVVRDKLRDRPEEMARGTTALNQIMDLELAIMLETYREDLVAKNRQAERQATIAQFAAVGTMAAGLAHEVRNPLNSAALQLAVLERRLERSGVGESTLPITGIIRSEIDRLERLVREFLTFAQPRALAPEPVPVCDLLEGVVAFIHPEAEAGRITAVVECADSPTIRGEPERLRQVLLNLTRNALEAMHEHGGRLVLRARRSGPNVEIEVADTGPGFSEDKPVFDAFYTTKPQGTGLGLSLVHRIVTDHGGTIRVRSRPGDTCFTITLPQA